MDFLARATQALPLELCYYGHPALRQECREIAAITPEIRELAERMIATMAAYEGVGLAAPQVGVDLQLLVLGIPLRHPEDGPAQPSSPGEATLQPLMPLALVNPRLTDPSPQATIVSEGCLSIPGVNADVERPEFVQLQALRLDGTPANYRCGGLLARCLQHEVDHLHATLFTDCMSDADVELLAEELADLKRVTLADLRRSSSGRGANRKRPARTELERN